MPDAAPPPPAPLVVDDAARVATVLAALAANRRAARGGRPADPPPGVTVLVLDPGGGLRDAAGGGPPPPTAELLVRRELVVAATGRERAGALHAMLEAPPATAAAAVRDHPRLTVVADRAAASALAARPAFTSEAVLVVLGHREPGISAEHRISDESRARLRQAARLARRRPFRAAVLSGYTSTGGLSEAEQMKQTWPEHLAPALLEVAGRSTAENASRSLPLILALGGIRRVVVVSSSWHLRVPYFFAPYRRFGLRVAYRHTALHGSWPRMLREELRGLPSAPRQRAEAMAGAAEALALLSVYPSAGAGGGPARRS